MSIYGKDNDTWIGYSCSGEENIPSGVSFPIAVDTRITIAKLCIKLQIIVPVFQLSLLASENCVQSLFPECKQIQWMNRGWFAAKDLLEMHNINSPFLMVQEAWAQVTEILQWWSGETGYSLMYKKIANKFLWGVCIRPHSKMELRMQATIRTRFWNFQLFIWFTFSASTIKSFVIKFEKTVLLTNPHIKDYFTFLFFYKSHLR